MRLRFCIALLLPAVIVLARCSSGGHGPNSDVAMPEQTTLHEVAGDASPEVVFADVRGQDGASADTFKDSEVNVAFDATDATCPAGKGCFGDPCKENADCLYGWCVEHLGAGACSMTCEEECPAGWTCKQVGGSGPDLVFICVSDFANLCRPCTTTEGCQSAGGKQDLCLQYPQQGRFCGGACGDGQACPAGFTCQTATTAEGTQSTQCVAEDGVCQCTEKSIALGLTTPCANVNEHGTCAGVRQCVPGGLSACSAPSPAAETCNGLDDDCDGDVDEPAEVEGDLVNLCDDDNMCTKDACLGASGCENAAQAGTECLDGDPCTAGDHCDAGVCLGAPVLCDDGNSCTDDQCDGAGGCIAVPNDVACDDGNPCTVADTCSQGGCLGYPVDCQCLADADCLLLEDGDVCNGSLFCDTTILPHLCSVIEASVVVCPEPEEGPDAICLKPYCAPESGKCSFEPDHEGAACSDGDACTIGDSCSAGQCSPGLPLTCMDANPCTDDGCNPAAGCTFVNNESPCSDGDVCTTTDACSGGSCVGGPALPCDDQNLCNGQESCDPLKGCLPGKMLVCDDGNSCNGQESCDPVKGCVAGAALDCPDGNPCTDDACDAVKGCVHLANAAACDDGDPCTTGDQCQGGVCTHSSLADCMDANPCTDDSCVPFTGCVYKLNTASCDDGNACTVGEACALGSCGSGQPVNCNDGNSCTDDGCEPAVGCVHEPTASPCYDGDSCTVGDTCKLGKCEPGVAIVCVDGDVCTDDSCDPAVGCVFTVNQAPCNDGNACTSGDACALGKCVSGPPIVCNDQNGCTKDACAPSKGCEFSPLPDETPCGAGLVCMGGKCVPIPDLCKGVDCGPSTACPPLQCEKATGKCVPVTNPSRYDGNLTLTSDADVAAAAQYSEVTGYIYVDKGSLTMLNLPMLTCVGAYVYVTGNAAMVSLKLPKLVSIGPPKPCQTAADCKGEQCVAGHCGGGPGRYLYLAGNTKLPYFDLKALQVVGEYVHIAGNTLLPTKCGEQLHAQLAGFGFAGGFTNTGGAAGPCIDPDVTLYPFTSHTFTNAGAEGTTGPNQAAVDAAYAGSQVAGHVTVDAALPGYQKWVVPAAGPYRIEAYGAEGGYPGSGGRGAKMVGDFVLDKGEILTLAVGQKGSEGLFTSGGGGGGSFVVRGLNTPLIIAGGGGSSAACGTEKGADAVTGQNGTAGKAGSSGGSGGEGGTKGNGGKTGSLANSGCGGGGFLTDGQGNSGYTGGKSYANGLTGGVGSHNGIGGFGGGAGSGNHGGAGGGGYSGGGGGTPNCPAGIGGGGGSYNSGKNPSNQAGANLGHGKVVITALDVVEDSDGDGVPDWEDPCPSAPGFVDGDGDGVCNADDQCPGSDDTLDTDMDAVSDGCDPCPLDFYDDSDFDGVCDSADKCPGEDDKADQDGDGKPDKCDPCPIDKNNDSDGDGVCDSVDKCPGADDKKDADGDAKPDACDPCPQHYFDDGDNDGKCGYDNSVSYPFSSHTFTNAGATLQNGPTQLQVDKAYAGTDVQGRIAVPKQGYQQFTVPTTGTYRSEAWGGEGGYPGHGGRGAYMAGDFPLSKGDVVQIVVGQLGSEGLFTSGGGGGGSFVVRANNQPLLVAGGGGSSAACGTVNGADAVVGTSGTAGAAGSSGGTGGAGGTNGGGGKTGSLASSGCGGGGLNTDGEGNSGYTGGKSFLNGAVGGVGSHNGIGGFGGGGGSGNHGGGGGGGYSGGGGGTPNCPAGIGGGGGSYNGGANPTSQGGANVGQGKVKITKL